MADRRAKPGGPTRGVRRPPEPGAPRAKEQATGEESHLPWGRRNYRILAAGGAAIFLGFVLLALGDTTFAPILLVGSYLGLIPWGIVAATRR